MGFTVNKPGMCTTIQDRGRKGYLGSGFSPSGVVDMRAFIQANILVENDPNAPVVEFCLAGPTLRFTTDTFIALTGGDFNAKLDGRPIRTYGAIKVLRGQVLSFGAPKNGVFGYLAIAGGGVDVPSVMGSKSTNLKCGIGGFKGRPLNTGDFLRFKTRTVEYLPNLSSHNLENDDAFYEFDKEEIVIRVIPGPQADLFTEHGLCTFFSSTYMTTSKSDRMGYRLEGPSIETLDGSDIVSDGIAFGAVQVPNHGQPIIMLSDRQTTGGYAKIGTVASVDIPRLAQRTPGRKLRFVPVTVQEAQRLYRENLAREATLRKRVNRPSREDVSPRTTARRLTPILEAQAEKSAKQRLWIQNDNPFRRETHKEEKYQNEDAARRVKSVGKHQAER